MDNYPKADQPRGADQRINKVIGLSNTTIVVITVALTVLALVIGFALDAHALNECFMLIYALSIIAAFIYGLLWAWWILLLLIRGARLVEALIAYIKKITP
jgi:hypothetical protein